MPGITGLTNTAANSISNTFAKQSSKAAESTAVIAGGSRLTKASVDASSLALSEKLRSNIEVLTQANRNAAQGASVVQLAVGAQQNILNLLTSMKSLTTKANDGSQNAASRALIDAEFQKLLAQVDNIANQVRWNGSSLLSGGAGAVSVAAAAGISVTGIGTIPANTFAAAPVDTTNSTGFISGSFTAASVVAEGNLYQVSVTMNNNANGQNASQTFKGTAIAPANDGKLVLQSTTDPNNVLVLTYAAAITGITDAATFQSALQGALNIGAGLQGTTVTSLATALNGGVSSVAAASTTPAGAYGLSYNGVSQVMTLSNGAQSYEVEMTTAGAQTVSFANGVSVALGSGFALGTAVTQVLFNVAASNSAVAMNFQVAEKATDTITINIAGSTSSVLGLTGQNVLNQANAVAAGDVLDAAAQVINSSIASLGSQQKQLEIASDNLKTTIENNVAARGVYNDADIPEEMAKLTQATVFTQLSQAMLSQAMELQKGLVQLAR